MSDKIIADFLSQPENIRQKYLIENGNDIKKAATAFSLEKETKKFNTFYAGGSQSAVAVMGHDDMDQAYTQPEKPAPKQPVNAFTGPSHSIGSGSAQAPPPAQRQNIPPKRTDYTTPGQPKTKVRFTFPDGSNLMLAVNLSATVGDLRSYIAENRPDVEGKAIKLCVSPGNTSLDDDSLTIEAGKLKMANIACIY
ncbi:hypothetical protein M9Y10_017430 [Tritrichomonas musculus]|uniref:Uncharacterized protein n=1 Tax=Tritrichomonas musculus TaxID=1915356 RepID=A0ABR2HUE5_9EUKA